MFFRNILEKDILMLDNFYAAKEKSSSITKLGDDSWIGRLRQTELAEEKNK